LFDSKLILIEGLAGSGKTTTTEHLASILQYQGVECQYFSEDADPHPIPCLEYEIEGLTPKMVSLWKAFVKQAVNKPVVTIIESRLW
jgi:thymidylate kinase